MKKYSSPTLVSYGNVETLTQANGHGKASDFVIFTGQFNGSVPGRTFGVSGSRDVKVKI